LRRPLSEDGQAGQSTILSPDQANLHSRPLQLPMEPFAKDEAIFLESPLQNASTAVNKVGLEDTVKDHLSDFFDQYFLSKVNAFHCL
jgi:hypothetical protein